MRNQYISKLLLLWLFLALGGSAVAVQNNWTGTGGDMLWTNSANWSLGVLPDLTQDVVINDTGTNAVFLNAPAEVANLSIGNNAVLNVAADLTTWNTAAIDGTLDWISGGFSVLSNTVIHPSGLWTIRSTAAGTLAGVIANDGTISCFATNIYGTRLYDPNRNNINGPDLLITNSHLFVINTNVRLDVPQQYEAGFVNTGTLLVPAGNSNLTITAACRFNSTGTIYAETNSSVTVRQGRPESLLFGPGSVFDGPGLIRLTDGTSPFALDALFCVGNMTVNGTVELGGGSIFGSSGGTSEFSSPATVWGGSGVLRWKGGKLGPFVFDTDFHVEITGAGTNGFGGPCTNRGTIRCLAAGSLVANFPVSATGEWVGINNQGEFILETNCTLAGTFTNSGTLKVPAAHGAVKLALGPDFVSSGILVAETNSTLNLEGDQGFGVFCPGTIFDGAGVIRFIPGAESYGHYALGNMVVNGTVEIAGALVNLNGTWTGPGLLRWTSGGFYNSTFATNFNVEISGSADKKLSATCTNLGTIHWRSPGPMIRGPYGSGSFFNLGQLILETNCTISDCSFYNEGIVRVPADYGLVTLTNLAPYDFNNSSLLLAETNSILAMVGLFSLNEGTVLQGPGFFRLLNYAQNYLEIRGTGNIVVNTTVELAGATLGFGYWSGPGILRFLAGNFGNFTLAPDFHVEVSGSDDKKMGGVCTNLGSFHVQGCSLNGPGWSWGATQFYNAGLFTVDDTGAWDVGGFVNLSTGIFRQTNGQFTLGSIDNAGTIEVKELNTTGQLFNTNSLTVNGHLNVGGTFYNAGSLKLDGKVNANDGFQQYPSASLEMLLHEEDTSATQLSAPGFVFGGSLTASLVNGFTPTNGSVFMIATNFGQRWEEFSTVTLPSLPAGLVWRISNQTQSPQSVALVVTTPTSVTNATVLPNGSFQFTLTGSPGGMYEIQASTNLVDWTTLTNAPFGGAATFTDTKATNFTRRFYRGVIGD